MLFRSTWGFVPQRDEADVEQSDYQRIRDTILPQLHELFRPEFLNRVDDIVFFQALTRTQVRAILDLMLSQTEARLSEQLIALRVSDEAKALLAGQGYDREYGARPLRRVVQRLVEDRLAEGLLRRLVKPGECINIEPDERGALRFRTAASVLALAEPEQGGEGGDLRLG